MSESVPRISVLIRSVARPTLSRALLSVYEQDLPVRILVVRADAAAVEGLPKPPAGMTLEVSVPGHALARSAAANHLLDRAGTELALFLDDDDELLAGHLQRLALALDEHPQAAAAYAGVRCVTGPSHTPHAVHVYDRDVRWVDMQLQNVLPIHAVMFRTAFVQATPALRMPEQLQQFEDWDFWLQLMARGGDFVRVPGVSAVYHLDAAEGSGHAVHDSEVRGRNLEKFARLQLSRWTDRDVAALIVRQSQILGDETQRRQELEQARQQWAAAQEAQIAATQDAGRIRADLATVQEHAAALASDRDRVLDERRALESRLGTQRTQLAALQAEFEAVQAQTDVLQAHAEFLQGRNSALQSDREALQGQLEAYRREGDLLAALRLDHLQQIERLQAQVTAIHRSTSWRLTRPVRGVGRALAFVRSGRLAVLLRNTSLAVRNARRRHGTSGLARRMPHYLRHARRFMRVLTARPPLSDLDPFSAPPVPRGTPRLHPELAGTEETVDARVSVVIPTLNAGEELGWLLRKLQAQRAVREVEVVVVDSGSSDGSPALAREWGAKVVEIAPAEFTHSHARNLGADAATGDYLLFMVQDAYPIGELWLYGMLRYLLDRADQGVVAASCAEYSRSDSDLMYDCNIATHYRFLGCLDADRIGVHAGDDHMALRSMGQLSDVSCLIPRPLFMRYRYRGDYAEDLDLGIRLIRDGHKVAMLASVKVIHSHNRPAYYYLKRSFVDVIFLVGLFDDFHCPPCESMVGLAQGAHFVAARLTGWLAAVDRLADGVTMDVELARWLQTLRDAPGAEPGAVATGDARVDAFLADLEGLLAPLDGLLSAATVQSECARFVDSFIARADHFRHYLASVHGPADARVRREVADAMRKTLASTLGAALAFLHLDRRSAPEDDCEKQIVSLLFRQLRAGV